ncbi:TPA_asm: hypothetical protein, partial [ssRNA phage SRR5466366_1]
APLSRGTPLAAFAAVGKGLGVFNLLAFAVP